MRSFFSSAQFSRFDLGNHVLSQRPMELGVTNPLKDILSTIGLDASDIQKIQDPTVRAQFKDSYDRCSEMDTAKKVACLAELGAKVYAKLQEESKQPYVPMQPVVQPSTFPWIPVTIGLAAAGGLVYFLATKGK
jgi:hypothetical protein